MEENEGTQICPNCNREIPKVNFVTHSVHCVRNIKICPVCKEPVPHSELDDHYDKLHQLVPCSKCGEMVRGTDMEDHTRDSCAFTMQSCRFCSLELPRRDVPAHERYCGARTERCAECGEYVMLRYRQLHVDSNHGFVRLREDSPPRPGMRVVNDPTPIRPPANSRPRFPPYVPLSDIVRPTLSREESLRLIARCRAMQGEQDQAPHLTDEDVRHRIIATIPLLLPTADDRDGGERGTSVLRERERLIANLRGRAVPPDTLRRDVMGDEAVGLGPSLRNTLGRNPGIRVLGRNNAARQRVRQDIIAARTAMEHDAAAPNAPAPNAEAPNAVGQNVATPNAEAPNIVGQNKAIPNAEAENAVNPNSEAQNSVAPNARPAEPLAGDGAAEEELLRVIMAGEEESEEEIVEVSRPRPSTGSRTRSNYRVILKRTNDQPQINTTVTVQDKAIKKLGLRGAVKKRPAPAAPSPFPLSAPPAAHPAAPPPPPDPRRDLPYYSALQRRQNEDRRRQEQTAYNLSVGLPPVLDPAAKLEKLRKMDALHNREGESSDYRGRLQGRVWNDNNNVPAGHSLGRSSVNIRTASSEPQAGEVEQQRRQLANLQPMSADEFMERFNELQLIKEPPEEGNRGRFGDIRSSLRELRRGLNEVTAPYNNSASNNNNNNTNKNNNVIESSLHNILNGDSIPDTLQLDEARALDASERSPEADVMVPCEFCYEPLRASEILDHERACRQGLTSARGRTPSVSPTRSPRALSPWDDDNIPVIPCEFCTATLPFYLINEHQELCGRESQLLYPD